MGKGKIACYEQFFLFRLCSQKTVCKSQGLFGKGLKGLVELRVTISLILFVLVFENDKLLFVLACKYDKRQWGPCNAATNTVTRTLTLKDGDPSVCNKTRTDVRKCKDKHLRPHG